MKKYFYLALVCLASATMFTACNEKGKNNPDDGKTVEGEWITSPDQLKNLTFNDSINDCYQWDVWCDGTTISREYLWTTEATLVWMIQQIMADDLKKFGEYHRRHMYTKVEEPTEASCTSRQWEGAECWLETITYRNQAGEQVNEQQYCWMPEANMKERHAYYKANLETIGAINHEYERANANDKDACLEMNPEDPITPPSGENACWELTVIIDGAAEISYLWTNETAVKNQVAAYNMVGYTASYKRADANDEYSCLALNDEE